MADAAHIRLIGLLVALGAALPLPARAQEAAAAATAVADASAPGETGTKPMSGLFDSGAHDPFWRIRKPRQNAPSLVKAEPKEERGPRAPVPVLGVPEDNKTPRPALARLEPLN